MIPIPFQTLDWSTVPKTENPGVTGTAYSQTLQLPGLRIRVVEYSADYLADHWCQKGHVIYCLEGEFVSDMETGETANLSKGMMYVVSDEMSSHRSKTKSGAKLLIIDGDFLAVPSE